MQLTKPLIAGGASGLLVAGAILGNVLLGSVAAAGLTPGPSSPPTVTRSATTVAGTSSVTKTSPDAATKATAADTDNVKSGAQSGAQVEDTTPDVAGAAGAKETPEAAGQEADLSTPATPPTVTQAAASKAALAAVPGANSTPVKVKLDDENGQPVYHVLLVTATGQQMVKVNGLTGAVTLSHDTGTDASEAPHAPESPEAN